MKTPALLLPFMALAFGPLGAADLPVIDATAIAKLSTIDSKLNGIDTLLTTANSYLEKLKTMAGDYGNGSGSTFPADIRTMRDALTGADDGIARKIQQISDVLGDPKDVPTSKFTRLKNVVNDWINTDGAKFPSNPKYDKSIDDPTNSNGGSSAFNATADGLFDAIGAKYKPDPTKSDEIDRNKKLYVGPANQLAAVRHYYDIRKEALNRRDTLQTLLKDTLDTMANDADSFAHVAKYSALLNSIESQIKVCNDDINTAYNDVVVRGVQMLSMSQIKTTADNEPLTKQLEDKTQKASELDPKNPSGGKGTSPPGTSSTGSSTLGFFPWVKFTY